ncbi:hypothetical protein [Archangium violaceum]|uniref:hypothetical protein n=1 Tax=Archangium violaceum TaxID=83451 RepID=UPI0037BF5C8D
MLAVLALLASGPVACASHPPPDALAATRDALAGLDEFGALLLGAGLPVEAIPQGRSVSPVQAERLRRYFAILPYLPQHYAPRVVRQDGFLAAALTGEPTRWVGPVEVRNDGAGAGAFEMGEFNARADGESWRRADRPNLDRL